MNLQPRLRLALAAGALTVAWLAAGPAARADYITTGLILNLDASDPASRSPATGLPAASSTDTIDWSSTVNSMNYSPRDGNATYDLVLDETAGAPAGITHSYFLHGSGTTSGGVSLIADGTGAINNDQSALSIEVWFRADSMGQVSTTLYSAGADQRGVGINLHDDEDADTNMDLDFRINYAGGNDKTLSVANAVTDTEWHQVVATFLNHDYMRLYLDGVEIGSLDVTTPDLSDNGGIRKSVIGFGRTDSDGAWVFKITDSLNAPINPGYFNGEIAVVREYSTQLTDAEVLQNYQAIATAVPEPATVAFLAFGGLAMAGGAAARRRRRP